MWEKQKFKAKGINYFRVHIIRWWGWYNPERVMLLGCYWKCPICNVVVIYHNGIYHNLHMIVLSMTLYSQHKRHIKIAIHRTPNTIFIVNTLYTKSPFQVFLNIPKHPVNSVLFSCLIVLHSMSSSSSFSLCHISEYHHFLSLANYFCYSMFWIAYISIFKW